MATPWRIYGDLTVASKLDRAELPGFFRKRSTVGPGEAAVIIRGGKIERVITESSATVSGFWDQLWSSVGLANDLEVLFVDISPITLSVFLGQRSGAQSGVSGYRVTGPGEARSDDRGDAGQAVIVSLSRDGEVIPAEARVSFRINLDDAKLLNGLLKGRPAIAVPDLEVMVREVLLGPILPELVVRYDAADFRGGSGIREKVEAEAWERLGSAFAQYGLKPEGFSITWGLTEPEARALAQKRATREEEDLNFGQRRQLAEMHRQSEVGKTRLSNLQELKLAEAQGNEELKNMLLTGEVNRADLSDHQRLNVAKVDTEIAMLTMNLRERELAIAREDERLRKELEVRLGLEKGKGESEELMNQFRQVQEAKRVREQAERDSHTEQMKIQTGSTERIMSEAVNKGIADAEALREMMRQQTLQRALDRDPSKVESLARAASSERQMDTYKEGQDRERQQQGAASGAAANLLRAAGGGVAPFGAAAVACPSCAEPVQAGWKACPKCGSRLGKPICRGCGAEVPAISKFCPHCGQAVAK